MSVMVEGEFTKNLWRTINVYFLPSQVYEARGGYGDGWMDEAWMGYEACGSKGIRLDRSACFLTKQK